MQTSGVKGKRTEILDFAFVRFLHDALHHRLTRPYERLEPKKSRSFLGRPPRSSAEEKLIDTTISTRATRGFAPARR